MRSLILRLIAAYVVVVTGVLWGGDSYVRSIFPGYAAVIERLLPEWRITNLNLDRLNQEPVIQVTVRLVEPLPVGGQRLPPGGEITASTLKGHALQHPLVLYPIVLSWPGLWRRAGLIRLGISVPLLLAVEGLDVPLVLVGSVEDLVLANLAPDQLNHSLSVRWMHTMNGGGRLALALAAAWASIAFGRWMDIRYASGATVPRAVPCRSDRGADRG